jgi:hypothetical protein
VVNTVKISYEVGTPTTECCVVAITDQAVSGLPTRASSISQDRDETWGDSEPSKLQSGSSRTMMRKSTPSGRLGLACGEVIFAARNSAQPNRSEGQGSQDGAPEYSEVTAGIIVDMPR